MRKKILTSILALLLAAIFVARAQAPAYLHYDTNDGLPSALVYCIEQDDMGVMWFGTDKGLVRFDGSRFRTFTIKDGLPDNEVLNLYNDSKGRLWLSCFRNKPCYMQHGKIVTEQQDPMLRQLDINTGTLVFGEDQDSALWIAAGITRFCRVTKDNQVICPTTMPSNVTETYSPNLHAIQFVGNEMVGLGNFDVVKISKQGVASNLFSFPFIKNNVIVSVSVSGNRVICSKTQGMVLLNYDGKTMQILAESKGDAYGNAYTDKSGRFWISSHTGGAICFDHERDGLSKPIVYLRDTKVTRTFEDKEGNFWFSTFNAGIYTLPKKAAIAFTKENCGFFNSDNLTALAKLPNGDILVGDDAGSIYRYNHKNWSAQKINNSRGINRVLQITPLTDNEWLAVSDKGVYTSNSGLMDCFQDRGSPKSLTIDGDEFWLGTSHALLQRVDANSKCEVIKQQRYTALCKDAEHNLWAGGLNGLYSQKDNFEKSWGQVFEPLTSRILDIKLAKNGMLWVATPDYGLLKVSVKHGEVRQVQIINDSLKTPIENVQSIFLEPDGELWLATNTGVFGLEKDFSIKHYDKKNGLVNNNVQAVMVESDTLWVATASGLSKLQMREQNESGDFPTRFASVRYNVGIEKIYLDLLAHLDKQPPEITLPAGSSLLEVELAGLNYRNRGNMRFEYRISDKMLPLQLLTFKNLIKCLSNFWGEKEEVTVIDGATRNFGANLTPGSYLMTITAILPGGTPSTQPDQIVLTVLPYWWQTIWVSLAIIGGLGFGVWRLIKARHNYLKMQSVNSELQLQAIRAQMNPHFVGNSINAIQQFFYPPDPIKASEYISIFSDLLRRTMHFSETDFIRFQDELAYLRDYLEMIKLRFGDRFSYEIIGAEKLPGNVAFPAMLLQPILENATLHGLSPLGHSHLKIEFELVGKRLTCNVTDNGVGIEESKTRKQKRGDNSRISRGIHLLEKKVQSLNLLYPANIRLSILDLSQTNPPGQGTQASLSFLVLKNVVAKDAPQPSH